MHLCMGQFSYFYNKLAPPWRIYPRGSTHMSGVLPWMLSRCVIKWWELRDSLAEFSQRWQGIRQGIRSRAHIWGFMLQANGKGEFFRVENKTSISRREWIISARTSWTRKGLRLFCKAKLWKKTLHPGIELITEFPKQCLTSRPIRVFDSFLLFLFVWGVWKSFWVAHLHNAAFALSSPSQCFQLSRNLDNDFFRCLFCRDAATTFTNAKRLLTSCVFL